MCRHTYINFYKLNFSEEFFKNKENIVIERIHREEVMDCLVSVLSKKHPVRNGNMVASSSPLADFHNGHTLIYRLIGVQLYYTMYPK